MPNSLLPSFFKPKFQVPRWLRAKRSSVRTIEIHRQILKNLLLQNHLAQMLEIRYVALPSGLNQVC